MKNLQELVYVVNRYKTRNIEIIGNVAATGKSENKYQQFYEAICAKQFETDEEAAIFFGYKTPSDKGYRRLKAGLKKRILNTSLFLDHDNHFKSKHQKIYYRCAKIWVMIKTINSRSGFNTSYELAESIVKDLEKIEATSLLYTVLDFLRIKSAFFKSDKKKFKYYQKLSKQCLQHLNDEDVVKNYYAEIMVNFNNSKKYSDEFLNQINSYVVDLKKIKHKKSTSVFLQFYYFICIAHLNMQGKFEETIVLTDEAIFAYGNTATASNNNLIALYYQKVAALLSLNRLNEAEKELAKFDTLLPHGSFNWIKGCELSINILLHQQKFSQAWNLYKKVIHVEEFKTLNQVNIEQWKLMEAWMHFFHNHGLIKQNISDIGKFKINKFLNEVPLYSKDKSGMNIQLIIVQILFSLQEKKYSIITDKTDALKKYTARHLKKNDSYRSNIFIRMLIILAECSFHKTATLRKVEKLWGQLQNMPPNLVDTNLHTEKVPFEMTWHFILEYLDDQVH